MSINWGQYIFIRPRPAEAGAGAAINIYCPQLKGVGE